MTATSTAALPLLSTRRRWTVLCVCAAAMFVVGLGTTIGTWPSRRSVTAWGNGREDRERY
jgi:hypothetical protein